MHYWPTIRSFTGQPMIELHMIGSPPLLDATIETLCRYGARLARRGEFTLRAFLSGRIDLLQAEAVLGITTGAQQVILGAWIRRFDEPPRGTDTDAIVGLWVEHHGPGRVHVGNSRFRRCPKSYQQRKRREHEKKNGGRAPCPTALET